MKPKKPIKRIRVKAFGILNAFGEHWTNKTFSTSGHAENYMKLFWGNMENPPDMSKHKVVEVYISFTKPKE